jgi:hypothetical protein
LTGKNSPPILPSIESNALSNKIKSNDASIALHGKMIRSASAISGAVTKARFGAVSCTASAFPQWAEAMAEVIVVIPEGR